MKILTLFIACLLFALSLPARIMEQVYDTNNAATVDAHVLSLFTNGIATTSTNFNSGFVYTNDSSQSLLVVASIGQFTTAGPTEATMSILLYNTNGGVVLGKTLSYPFAGAGSLTNTIACIIPPHYGYVFTNVSGGNTGFNITPGTGQYVAIGAGPQGPQGPVGPSGAVDTNANNIWSGVNQFTSSGNSYIGSYVGATTTYPHFQGNLNMNYTNYITVNHVPIFFVDVTNDNIAIGQATFNYLSYNNSKGSPPTTAFNTNNAYLFGNAVGITGQDNLAIGMESGQDLSSGSDNLFIGSLSGAQVTVGSGNVVVGGGGSFGNQNFDSSNNVVVGFASDGNKKTERSVIVGANSLQNANGTNTELVLIGESSGSAYTLSESTNILIDNTGVVGENNTIHIGNSSKHLNTYLEGGVLHGNGSGLTNVLTIGQVALVGTVSDAYAANSGTFVPITNAAYTFSANCGVSARWANVTNSSSGIYSLGPGIIEIHASTVAGSDFKVQFFTNGVACGPPTQPDWASLLGANRVVQYTVAAFPVLLPANTIIDLRIDDTTDSGGWTVYSGSFTVMKLQ